MSINRALERVEMLLEINQRNLKATDLLRKEIKKLEAVANAGREWVALWPITMTGEVATWSAKAAAFKDALSALDKET